MDRTLVTQKIGGEHVFLFDRNGDIPGLWVHKGTTLHCEWVALERAWKYLAQPTFIGLGKVWGRQPKNKQFGCASMFS